uniref:Ig-like domain-containing protein n=1 Tax=Oryzias latipes TaxID=8090 RepID=A0A3P9L375_ORYLA
MPRPRHVARRHHKPRLHVQNILMGSMVGLESNQCKGEDKVIQPGGEVIAAEGDSFTLNCTFETIDKSAYLFWYKQEVNRKPPEFLVSHSSSGTKGNEKVKELKIQVENKQINLKISSAAVTDSAVYYCAVEPTVTGNNKTLYKNLQ